MIKISLLPLLFFSSLAAFSFTVQAAERAGTSAPVSAGGSHETWRPLLDEKLSAWETWIGSPHDSVKGLPEGTPTSANGTSGAPLGLNNDPKKVFSLQTDGGEPVLHISGEIYGALSSRETFSNYHFRTQFKWGERKWEPRLSKPRDNGILYHCTGAHGAFWNVWKRCLEFQVQEKDMGDLYFLAGTAAELTATKGAKVWAYDPAGELNKAGGTRPSIAGSVAHKLGDFEKPNGEWNTLEIYTVGRDAVHVVNGEIVLVLRNAVNVDAPGQPEVPLSAGGIQIQSEAAEAYYRRMEISSISAFPEAIKSAASL